MSIKKEAVTVFKDVGKGLLSIVVPLPNKKEPDPNIQLHYCEQCKKYHRVP
jgi:hypothetical protein